MGAFDSILKNVLEEEEGYLKRKKSEKKIPKIIELDEIKAHRPD